MNSFTLTLDSGPGNCLGTKACSHLASKLELWSPAPSWTSQLGAAFFFVEKKIVNECTYVNMGGSSGATHSLAFKKKNPQQFLNDDVTSQWVTPVICYGKNLVWRLCILQQKMIRLHMRDEQLCLSFPLHENLPPPRYKYGANAHRTRCAHRQTLVTQALSHGPALDVISFYC